MIHTLSLSYAIVKVNITNMALCIIVQIGKYVNILFNLSSSTHFFANYVLFFGIFYYSP